MKKWILLAVLGFFPYLLSAQLLNVDYEVVYTDDGTVAGYPAGYSTYRIYAYMQDPIDFLSAVYSTEGHTLEIGSCSGNIWNHGFGKTTGDQIDPALFATQPGLEYDSWVTVGRASMTDPGGAVLAVSSVPTLTEFEDHLFNTPSASNLVLEDGSWFTTFGEINGLPTGPDNRILIAQITSDDVPKWELNMQVFDDNNPINTIFYVVTPLDITETDGSALGLLNDPCGGGGVDGCTDTTACNYDSTATNDDGSCTYPGCNDTTACNYDSVAGCDDGSCTYPGCSDTAACNYDSTAGCDDGSCTYPGCMDMTACNYDSTAGCDDGSCTYPGCNDTTACNYDSTAGCDDGSCTYPGCTDSTACNYDATAGCDDGSCNVPDGCTDPSADNYDSTALCDDGSCTWDVDLDGNGVVQTTDLLIFLQNFGCVGECTGDFDDNGVTGISDLLIFIGIFAGQNGPN